jgi:hypothetical protein
MKKVIVLLVFVFIGSCNLVYGQTRHEKNQLNILESEISKVESVIDKLENKLEKEKKLEIFVLKKKISIAKKYGDPRVATDFAQVNTVKAENVLLNAKIDSIESINSTIEINLRKTDLVSLQLEREEMITAWTSPQYSIPREMRVITKNRRQRSNVVRREELVLSKIESNLNQSVIPTSTEGGYKIIFDNQYSLNTTFILRGVNGGSKLAVSIAPKQKERHYVIPGNYLVEYYVGGRKLSTVSKLTVDGEVAYYESEPCFGFVYKSRY